MHDSHTTSRLPGGTAETIEPTAEIEAPIERRPTARDVVVVLGDRKSDLAWLEGMATRGEDPIVLCPPERKAALGRFGAQSRWISDRGRSDPLIAPSPELMRSVEAREALLALAKAMPVRQVRFAAVDASAWATVLAVRLRGELLGCQIVVDLEMGDGALAEPVGLEEGFRARLVRDAAQIALRDADVVEGNEEARKVLTERGWTLGSPRPAPRWEAKRFPSISAVVTHKDLGQYLSHCLASIRAQTFPVEIILVDDGSNEEGWAAVKEEARLDPSMKIIRHANVGPGASRNIGVRAASGELVCFVDADNTIRPHFIERLAEALRLKPDAAFAVPGHRRFDDESNSTLALYCPIESSPSALFVANTFGDTCALHWRDAFLEAGGFNEERSLCEDWDLWFRYVNAKMTGAFVPELLFDYRIRKSSRNVILGDLGHAHMPFRLASLHPKLWEKYGDEAAAILASKHFLDLQELFEQCSSLRRQVSEQLTQLSQSLARNQSTEARALEAEHRAAHLETQLKQTEARAAGAEAREKQAEERINAMTQAEMVFQQQLLSLQYQLRSVQKEYDGLYNSAALRSVRLVREINPDLQKKIGVLMRKLLAPAEHWMRGKGQTPR